LRIYDRRDNDIAVLVDVWAPWCARCRAMAPMFERAAAELEPEVRLIKLNADEEPGIASELGSAGSRRCSSCGAERSSCAPRCDGCAAHRGMGAHATCRGGIVGSALGSVNDDEVEVAMNVDRAVLAFAGVMILVSLLLAWYVSPYWLLLTMFVGLNMLQAAFTGLCPAAIIFRTLGLKSGCAFQ
jgi:thiol-disulfide isomerase/thioredoxin